MAKVMLKKKGTDAFLRISGKADISHAVRLRECFARLAADDITAYHLDLSRLEETDVSFIQLVVSFRNSLLKEGKVINFENLPSSRAISAGADTIGLDIRTII